MRVVELAAAEVGRVLRPSSSQHPARHATPRLPEAGSLRHNILPHPPDGCYVAVAHAPSRSSEQQFMPTAQKSRPQFFLHLGSTIGASR